MVKDHFYLSLNYSDLMALIKQPRKNDVDQPKWQPMMYDLQSVHKMLLQLKRPKIPQHTILLFASNCIF